ncbi:MAG: protocatechuate 3,4-dioxygenase subunit alpha [Chloroflexi bacterium]|nr:MAG: protocatechuate 3,4-dioxygenase subunit alpha [Chloroflexota bacterium]TME02348.1 MAG: protocatechuate 3,4-dioxygenase subunit alpha [Chloroflexota bacterium]TME40958.1 MAG: protocatechuate 3,4-dioxygenase subunit alpha [Chloroflexota bacterium]
MVPTPSQTVGPFFGFALPFDDDAISAADGIRIEGQVLDGAGQPVPDALLEVSQEGQFGRCQTDEEGAFHFTVRKPAAGFFEVTLFARGLLRHLNTRIYFPGEEDAVLASIDPKRRHTLVARGDGGVLRFDVRLQGIDETVFFE